MAGESNWQMSGNPGADYEQFLVPAMFGPWTPVLVDFAVLSPGDRALDVACGTGIVARALAQRVGAGGVVIGCDNNADMLATAKQIAPEHVSFCGEFKPVGYISNWRLLADSSAR